MTKKQKHLIFLSLLLSFFIVAPITIFYFQGYRFDWQNKKLTKTGGIFLKIKPSGATVYLNHILYKKTNVIFDSLLIDNLPPKKYHILIRKDNYQDWEKEFFVSEMLVTEAKNIHLFAKKYPPELILQQIKKIFIAPNQKYLIVEKQDNQNSWSLWLFDTFSKQEKKLISLSDFLFSLSDKEARKFEPREIIFSRDSQKIIIVLEDNHQSFHYFFLDINHSGRFVELPLDNYEVVKLFFNPQNESQLIVWTKRTVKRKLKEDLMFFDQNFKIHPINPFISDLKLLDIAPFNNSIYLLADNGLVYKTSFVNSSLVLNSVLNLQPKNINSQKKYRIFIFNPKNVFLTEDNTLYYLNPKNYKFQLVMKQIDKFSLSPNNDILVFSSQKNIFLFYLADHLSQPKAFRWERIKLLDSTAEILQLDWFDPFHIIYSDKNGIYIAEIDFRDNVNKSLIITLAPKKFFWQKSQNSLFFVSRNNLFQINIQ
ncbi:hypothetical protein J7K92_00650 [bacterium]|nr:hypothetical protein [bacterium]